jgi:hypothetical protein
MLSNGVMQTDTTCKFKVNLGKGRQNHKQQQTHYNKHTKIVIISLLIL